MSLLGWNKHPRDSTMGRGVQMVDAARPWVAINAWEAKGFLERTHGLLDVPAVGSGRGLLLRARQVHTLGMTFAIDTVYLKGDGTVLKVKRLNPWRIGPFVPRARWVVEMDAGEAARLGIAPGSRLVRTAGRLP